MLHNMKPIATRFKILSEIDIGGEKQSIITKTIVAKIEGIIP